MKKQDLVSRPVKTSALDFDELYDQIIDNRPAKAQRLQTRRWRKLKRDIKGSIY